MKMRIVLEYNMNPNRTVSAIVGHAVTKWGYTGADCRLVATTELIIESVSGPKYERDLYDERRYNEPDLTTDEVEWNDLVDGKTTVAHLVADAGGWHVYLDGESGYAAPVNVREPVMILKPE